MRTGSCSRYRWGGNSLRNKPNKAGGIMTARLLYALLLSSMLVSAYASTVRGVKGNIIVEKSSQFSVTQSGNSVQVIIPMTGSAPEIPADLKDFVSIGGKDRLIISIPLDKEPKISINRDSLRIIWINSGSPADSSIFSKEAPAYPLGTGDMILVEVYGLENMNKEVVVDPAGYVTLPLLERLSVKNMAINEIQKLLEEKYSDYINNPQVNIQLKEYGSRFVNIIGEVSNPGRIPLKSTFRLLDAVSEAGGFTSKSGDIEIQRRDDSGTLQKKLILKESLLSSGEGSENIFVFDQDTINVLPVSSIYISGQVKAPQSIEYKKDLTLLRAIAKVGGFTEWANKDKVIILRQDSSGQTEPIKVDAEKIENGKIEDIPLLPNDQIVVYERKLF